MAQQNTQYLESKVLTAAPHRLHLMLIEGALRFGRQAEQELNAGNHVAAAGPMMRVLDIVGEMLVGVRKTQSDLNDKLAAVYWFIFRRVSEATISADAAALTEVLQLLEFERETWQKVCEKFGTSGSSSSNTPAPMALNAKSSTPLTGISLQA